MKPEDVWRRVHQATNDPQKANRAQKKAEHEAHKAAHAQRRRMKQRRGAKPK